MKRKAFTSPPWRVWRWERAWSARTASAIGLFASQVSMHFVRHSDSTISSWTPSVRSSWRVQRRRHYGAARLKPHTVIVWTPSGASSIRYLPILMPFGHHRTCERITTQRLPFDLPHWVAELGDDVGVRLSEGIEVL